MKAKLLTSLIVGLVLPWTCFLVFTVGPVREIRESGEVVGESGLAGFIQFYGFADASVIYAQAVAVCGVVAFVICWVYEAVNHALKPKP